MFSLTSDRAFWAKVLAILGMNGKNFLPDMQPLYSEALQFSEYLSAARLFKSKKNALKSYSSAKTFSL